MYVDDYIGLINRDYVIIVRDTKERIILCLAGWFTL